MTKAQEVAYKFIMRCYNNGIKKFSWGELKEEVENSKCVVKNWLTIRGVLAYFIDNDTIKRTDDIRVEEYEVLHPIDD